MKKILALLLIVVMCLAVVSCNSGNNPNKDILGEWVSVDEEGEYVKFFEDGTGEFKDDGMMFDFEWEYDAENKNYRANIASRRFTFKTKTEEGITYLTGLGGYRFRAEDCEAALAAAPILRENYINRQIDGETLLPFGETISVGNATVLFEQIKLSEDKREILCSVSITASRDMTSVELNSLLILAKYTFFDEDCVFQAKTSGGSGTQIKLSENNLGTGETLKTEICIIDGDGVSSTLEKWGKYDGYAIIKCGGTEYYINLGEYTKQ